MATVEIQCAKKVYHLGETEIHALKGVDLSIGEGEFVALWGPSGSGKSTLCNLIGVIDDPSSGEVIIGGERTTDLSDDAKSELRNRLIGFVFQNFNLIPVLSALENVMLPLQVKGVSTRDARARAEDQLARMGLSEHRHHRPQKLSGGQRQRVAIARSLVTNPSLVIADEPTANLDSENALRIIEVMRRINEESGTAFVFSTHDDRLLERVDRQVRLQDGLIIADVAQGENPSNGNRTGSKQG